MVLLDRAELKRLLAQADLRLDRTVDLVLAGGGAVLVLAASASATRDLDAFPTDAVETLAAALRGAADLNIRVQSFETYLPEGWQERLRHSPEFSTSQIRVFTPSAEDLAVMKVFRFRAKDAEDIACLAELEDFSSDRFLRGFLNVLPIAVGSLRWHAQSFAMIWNRLYPDRSLTENQLLRRAGIKDS